MPIIEFRDVWYWYPNREKPALGGINLKVEKGEFILIIGSSGSGKSTLCRCINGLVPNFTGGRFKGKVLVDGAETLKESTNRIAKKVGMVFQDPENQFVMSTVESEIAFGLENQCLPRDVIKDRIDEALSEIQIESLRHRKVNELSSGEKQKVVMASILAIHPDILVLDEPTSQLDPIAADDIINLVKNLNENFNITIVLVEHRLESLLSYVDKVLDLDNNIFDTPREVIKKNPSVTKITALFNNLRKKGHSTEIPLSLNEAKRVIDRISINLKNKTDTVLIHDNVAIDVQDLHYSYSDSEVLSRINLKVYENEFVAIIGRNGSGKTTLIKHFNGLLKPKYGNVRIFRKDTSSVNIADLAKEVGILLQNPDDYLFSDTVQEELEFTSKNLGLSSDINDILKSLDLEEYKYSYPRDLSIGQKQRVAMASILVGNPKILVLDEPTRGIDNKSRDMLIDILKNLHRKGKTIVLVTHDVDIVAQLAERVLFMRDGKIIEDNPTRDVLLKYNEFKPQIAELFSNNNLITVDEVLDSLQ